jgi:hypothetical protein
MPLERERCEGDSCTASHETCPSCGSRTVTRRDDLQTPSPTDVVDYGRSLESVDPDDDGTVTITYEHVCWDCEWVERVEMTVDRTVEASDDV